MLGREEEGDTGVWGANFIMREVLPPQLTVPGIRTVCSQSSTAGCISPHCVRAALAYSYDTFNLG